jgi:predicted nucleic acid-binding protein
MATDEAALVVDSFAWVEYLRGTRLGRQVDRLVGSRRCATPTIALAELADKYARERIPSLRMDLDEIESRSLLVTLDRSIAEAAGAVKAEARRTISDFPLSDGIVYATARAMGADVLTGDPHFRGMRGVVFLA